MSEPEHNVIPAALAEYCERVRQQRLEKLQLRRGNMAEFTRVVLAACRPKPIEREAPTMEQVKENAILKALDRNGGVIQRAANELKIGRNTIYDTLKRCGSAVALLVLLVGCATEGNFTHAHGDAVAVPATVTSRSAVSPPTQSATATASSGAPVPQSPGVTLAWDESPSPGVAGYRIYFGSASEQYTNSVSVTGTNQVRIGNLERGTTYYFAATAYDARGVESSFSNEASYRIPTGARVEQLVVEVYESLEGPKVGEFVWVERYTNSIPGDGQKFLRLRQDLIQIQ